MLYNLFILVNIYLILKVTDGLIIAYAQPSLLFANTATLFPTFLIMNDGAVAQIVCYVLQFIIWALFAPHA